MYERENEQVKRTGNLHERVEREGRLGVARVARHLVELDELEVVEAAAGGAERVVELAHRTPGAVADAHEDDGDGPLGGLDDRVHRVLVLDAAIRNDHQDVVLRTTVCSTYCTFIVVMSITMGGRAVEPFGDMEPINIEERLRRQAE